MQQGDGWKGRWKWEKKKRGKWVRCMGNEKEQGGTQVPVRELWGAELGSDGK